MEGYTVLAVNSLIGTLWEVTSVISKEVKFPLVALSPYSTWLSASSSVVQVIVAVVAVVSLAWILVSTGGVVSEGGPVVKVKSPDVAMFPAASLDRTR